MNLLHRLRKLFRRAVAETELEREIAFHLEMETRALERAGMPAETARAEAMRHFGGIQRAKEECRDAWGTRFLDTLRQDLSYGWRGLRHNPGFTIIVVLTLALGIGANTAIFSVVNGVLLRPLPYTAPDRLVSLTQAAPKAGQPSIGFSVPDFMDFRARNRAFSAMSEYHSMAFILLGGAEPERVQTGVVSDNFFDLLGVKPILGRAFRAGEDKPGAEPVLMLSYHYWQTNLGGDRTVIGRVFQMNNKPHTVVGVLPPLPAFPNEDQIFMPASACPFRGSPDVLTHRNARLLSNVFARLKDGVTTPQAIDDTRRVGIELCSQFPESYPTNDGYTIEVSSVARAFTGNARAGLLLLLAMSGFVLLIACANVANLTLSRLLRRNREFAVRLALGASRGRIVRQLLTESMMLASLGGAAGLLLASFGVRALLIYAHHFLPRADEVGLDGRVLLFAVGVTLFTAVLFGSRVRFPADGDVVGSLKDGARGTALAHNRFRAFLVIGQIAVSVPLLVGAGLAAHHLYNLQTVDPGIDTSQVVAANITLNWTQMDTFEKRFGFWSHVVEEVRALPDVESVAVSGAEPLNGLTNYVAHFRIEHQTGSNESASPHAIVLASTDDYFKTVGEPLVRGRYFNHGDSHTTPAVAIINQALANHYWRGEDPIGRRITFDDGQNWIAVVGIVANTHQRLDADTQDELNIPLSKTDGLISATVLARTRTPSDTFSKALRAVIHRVDPNQPITTVETLAQVRQGLLAPPRLTTTLLILFALLALVITAAGIAGVLAFSVSQRTQEIGIWIALGASRASVLWVVARQALILVGVGLTVGTAGAVFVCRFMQSMLYGVPTIDVVTFAAVLSMLLIVATLAALAPARRAASISPMLALRMS